LLKIFLANLVKAYPWTSPLAVCMPYSSEDSTTHACLTTCLSVWWHALAGLGTKRRGQRSWHIDQLLQCSTFVQHSAS